MASTHLSLHYHIIFSTKDRAPTIAPACRNRLHGYMGGVIKNVKLSDLLLPENVTMRGLSPTTPDLHPDHHE